MPLSRLLIACCCAFAACACATHAVRLEFPDADAKNGLAFDCSVTDGQEKCKDSTVENPAANNRVGTEFVIMPRECKKNFHLIVVHDAGSSSPTVHVECSPPDGQPISVVPITATDPASAPAAAPGGH